MAIVHSLLLFTSLICCLNWCMAQTTSRPQMVTSPRPQPTEPSWIQFGDHIYQLVFNLFVPVTHQDAEKICFSKSAHLASIHSAEENAFIKDNMDNFAAAFCHWIGMNLFFSDGGNPRVPQIAKWTDGTRVDWADPTNTSNIGKYPWDSREPGFDFDVGNETCVCMLRSGWADVGCSTLRLGYICKKRQKCETGWSDFKDGCYQFAFNRSALINQSEAENICRSNRAHLASIHSAEEYAFITNGLAKLTTISLYWHGLRLIYSNDGLGAPPPLSSNWTDGTAVGWADPTNSSNIGKFPWAPGQPDNGQGNENCVAIRRAPTGTANWVDQKCGVRFGGYICKQQCPTGWILYRSYCYRFANVPSRLFTQSEAEQACRNVGANLVSIHSPEENDFVKDNIPLPIYANPATICWMGMEMVGLPPNPCTYTDGTSCEGYANPQNQSNWYKAPWGPFDPNNEGGQSCVFIYRNSDGITGWTDEHCDRPYPCYICKKPVA